ncbi:hypothetical protein HSB1_30050 [Halogranum salarium B-1]|uniref:Uncharacterized protein n=1 Tax=Halogranum salarium B-1 TaxID=1210908 RepID=J3EVA7_9EURY|nr:hypothetical protein HSB1_30050 [Halogranum salarium B-1]
MWLFVSEEEPSALGAIRTDVVRPGCEAFEQSERAVPADGRETGMVSILTFLRRL